MAWTSTFKQDTKVAGVGTVTAMGTDTSYSRRVDTNDTEDVDAFVVEAKGKETTKETEKTADTGISDAVTIQLNK